MVEAEAVLVVLVVKVLSWFRLLHWAAELGGLEAQFGQDGLEVSQSQLVATGLELGGVRRSPQPKFGRGPPHVHWPAACGENGSVVLGCDGQQRCRCERRHCATP